MSVQIMSEVFRYSKATLGTRLVLLAIADHADDETRDCWPSMALLGRKSLLSESGVHRAIRWLVRHGELEVTPRTGQSNLFRVMPLKGVASDRGANMTPPLKMAPGGANLTGGGVPPAPPRTIREPSMNHQRERARGWRRVPPSEQLTEDRKKMAWETKNLTAKAAADEWAAFMDYEFPNSHTDVDATWRNWCRKVKFTLPAPPPSPGKRGTRGTSPVDTVTQPTRLGAVVKDWHTHVPGAAETRQRWAEEDRRDREERARERREDVGL